MTRMAELSAHWGFDMTPMDDWPMTVEADGMEIKSLTIPMAFEDGKAADMRFVPAERLRDENDSLRDLLQEMLGACCVYHRCDFQCQYSYRANLKEQCRLRDKARDLGIEVG